MTDFGQRMQVGSDHETRIRNELEHRGWTVATYGQAVLPEAIRRALKTTDSALRWDPDFVAAQGSSVYLIDAKSSMRGEDAFQYTISRKALRVQRELASHADLPLYYVFTNLGVATPDEVMQFCRLARLGDAGGYVSFPAGLPRPFDDVFGTPPTATITALRQRNAA